MWCHLCGLEELVYGNGQLECEVLESSAIPETAWKLCKPQSACWFTIVNHWNAWICHLNLMLRSGASRKSVRHSMLMTCCTWAPPSMRGSTVLVWTLSCGIRQGIATNQQTTNQHPQIINMTKKANFITTCMRRNERVCMYGCEGYEIVALLGRWPWSWRLQTALKSYCHRTDTSALWGEATYTQFEYQVKY